MKSTQTPPLRDPLATTEESNDRQQSSSSSKPRPDPTFSLGLPRSKGGRSRADPPPGSTGATTVATASSPSTAAAAASASDASIRTTDNDALASRLSALKAGYLDASKDKFSEYFLYGHEFARGSRVSNVNVNASGSSGGTNVNASTSLPLNPPINRRPPIINIGTSLRCETLDRLVEAFLLHNGPASKQIVSLGAGSDARYWRIMANPQLEPHLAHYLELDFPQNITQKLYCIERFPSLREQLRGDVSIEKKIDGDGAGDVPNARPIALTSQKYTAQGCDLRDLVRDRHVSSTRPGSPMTVHSTAADPLAALDPSLPTLILAECVLSYIPPHDSTAILKAVAERIHPSVSVAGVAYEMCVAGERTTSAGLGPFGKVMLRNLEVSPGDVVKSARRQRQRAFPTYSLVHLPSMCQSRGLSVVGARAFSSAESHSHRFKEAFTTASHGATTLDSIWKGLMPSHRDWLSRLEGLDEVEELELLLGCYCISWGVRTGVGQQDGALAERFQTILRSSAAANS